MSNLTWTRTGRDERGWQATGANGRRYQIEKRGKFILLPTVDGVKLVTRDTLEECHSIADAYELAFQQADRLAKGNMAELRIFVSQRATE